jgi:carbon-monoxide dehydrogenase medium subunit
MDRLAANHETADQKLALGQPRHGVGLRRKAAVSLMKPAPFTLHRPASLDEALDILAMVGEDGKALAGGQSLIPMLNMRLASPGHLVDINKVPGLDGIEVGSDGVSVGALVRHAEVEASAQVAKSIPLLRQALRLVAHPVIRNRGTSVGSLAHADPSGELTAVLALLGGEVRLASKGAARSVPAADFFVGPMESCIQPGELAVSAWFPALPARSGTSFQEVARRHGDYAMCGVAAAVTVDDALCISRARVSYVSMTPTPSVHDITDAVVGQRYDAANWQLAASLAGEGLEPEADIHASATYRRRIGLALTARALHEAAQSAGAHPEPPTTEEPTR